MRAVIQRVMKASVSVGDELVSSIGKGLCVLVGINRYDNKKDMEFLVRKILNLRVFDDESGKRWAKSAKDLNLEILCVSQFTLYSVLKGNKPDFHQAMGGEESEAFYKEFLDAMRASYKPELIKDGRFGAYMQVNIQNDGPVTIDIESPPQQEKNDKKRKQAAPAKEGRGQASASTVEAGEGASAAVEESLSTSLQEKANIS